MKQIIRIKIDVTKLDKTAFFKGAKGTYAELTYFYNDDPNLQFGKNGGVKQDLGKDRRDEEAPFIGDGTIVPGSQKVGPAPEQTTNTKADAPEQDNDDNDDIPF